MRSEEEEGEEGGGGTVEPLWNLGGCGGFNSIYICHMMTHSTCVQILIF